MHLVSCQYVIWCYSNFFEPSFPAKRPDDSSGLRRRSGPFYGHPNGFRSGTTYTTVTGLGARLFGADKKTATQLALGESLLFGLFGTFNAAIQNNILGVINAGIDKSTSAMNSQQLIDQNGSSSSDENPGESGDVQDNNEQENVEEQQDNVREDDDDR